MMSKLNNKSVAIGSLLPLKKTRATIVNESSFMRIEAEESTNTISSTSSVALQTKTTELQMPVKDVVMTPKTIKKKGKHASNSAKGARSRQPVETFTSRARIQLSRDEYIKRRIKSQTSNLLTVVGGKKSSRPEIGTQTNEMEILDYQNIAGEVKIKLPSQTLIHKIEDQRQNIEKTLLKRKRKFAEHAKAQEQHLTSLSEFLDKASISRPNPNEWRKELENERKTNKSIKELLAIQIPMNNFCSDMEVRIRRKEKELLTLFKPS